MSAFDRSIEQQTFVAKLAETLLFDTDNKQLSSVDILRNAKVLIESLIVEKEFPDQLGCRFGGSSADRLVVSALKEINEFAQTLDESIVLKKRLILTLVNDSVPEHDREYMHQLTSAAMALSAVCDKT